MDKSQAIEAAELAVAKMLVGISDEGKRARAKEYAAAAFTIALRDAGLLDGYAGTNDSGQPVLVDPVTLAFSVNPGGTL